MLPDHPAVAVVSVTDLERARAFYEGTLGFAPAREVPDGVLYRAGGVDILVYPSSYAGTNKATALSFQVPPDAFDAEVADLRARGVTFQTFEMEGMTWDDGVATMAGIGVKGVWFADPDGNILNVDTELPAGS